MLYWNAFIVILRNTALVKLESLHYCLRLTLQFIIINLVFLLYPVLILQEMWKFLFIRNCIFINMFVTFFVFIKLRGFYHVQSSRCRCGDLGSVPAYPCGFVVYKVCRNIFFSHPVIIIPRMLSIRSISSVSDA